MSHAGLDERRSNSELTVKIAGTDSEPFNRSLSVYDKANKQATLNVLQFMMSESLWVADRTRGALDVLMSSDGSEFPIDCKGCSVLFVLRKIQVEHSHSFFHSVKKICPYAFPLTILHTDKWNIALCLISWLLSDALVLTIWIS